MVADGARIRAAGHNIGDGRLDRQGANECTSVQIQSIFIPLVKMEAEKL